MSIYKQDFESNNPKPNIQHNINTMYISKTRFINWTRCPMYFPMDLVNNPSGKADIDAERERREEIIMELIGGITSSEGFEYDKEEFDAKPSEELEALLPYYNQVENEALKVAKKYFSGTFISDSKDVHKQKLFEYESQDNTYRCYVDIYNENKDEINIIEVKATTSKKFTELEFSNGKKSPNAIHYSLFEKRDNIWRFITVNSEMTETTLANLEKKKTSMLDRYSEVGKYPHDIAFQKFVIENALRKSGDKRKVNYYLAVLNSDYVYDGAKDSSGARIYNNVGGQEIITFIDMNETAKAFQPIILKEIDTLQRYTSTLHDTSHKCDVGSHCAWGKNTQCIFWGHCFQELRSVPDSNSSNKYMDSGNTNWNKQYKGKYELVNGGKETLTDILKSWLTNENHKIQRDCYVNDTEYVDKEKMQAWFNNIEYPIYHFDFESFPCPLPRFRGEHPYQQSCFEFSLHIEHASGICDKEKDNRIFLNQECTTDEREALVEAIIANFEFNEDGTLRGTMLAQNTSFEIGRLKELAELFPKYKDKLLAIANKSADLIHLLKTNKDLYVDLKFDEMRSSTINYYHKDLSGSYSIKKTLPVLVPTLSYDDMKKHAVGNGVQAYVTYLNYDAAPGTTRDMNTKAERREALRLYCQQDTWAMVEILRAVREKIK